MRHRSVRKLIEVCAGGWRSFSLAVMSRDKQRCSGVEHRLAEREREGDGAREV